VPQYNNLPAGATQNYKDIKQKHSAVRAIILRPSRELKKLNIEGINLEAVLGYQRDILAALLYVSCKKARPIGPFAHCVVFLGRYKGAYINYVYNSSASKCLFYRPNRGESKTPKYRPNSLFYINV
jgi:hypothetical protein